MSDFWVGIALGKPKGNIDKDDLFIDWQPHIWHVPPGLKT